MDAVQARRAHAVGGALRLQVLVVLLERGEAALELGVEAGARGQLYLDGLEADAQVLDLVVVLLELVLEVGDAVLEEEDALGGALGALDEEFLDVLQTRRGGRG